MLRGRTSAGCRAPSLVLGALPRQTLADSALCLGRLTGQLRKNRTCLFPVPNSTRAATKKWCLFPVAPPTRQPAESYGHTDHTVIRKLGGLEFAGFSG